MKAGGGGELNIHTCNNMDKFREFPDGPMVRTLLTEWPEKKKKKKNKHG